MAQELTTAMKTAKEIEKQLVVYENRLAFVQDEVKRLTQTKDSMQAEIDKKTTDYNVYMAARDAESKKIKQDVLDAQNQLAKDKEEFQGILQQFQKDRQVFLAEKNDSAKEMAQAKAMKENIAHFVTAVQRALSVLGI